jgi:hypothetical protein
MQTVIPDKEIRLFQRGFILQRLYTRSVVWWLIQWLDVANIQMLVTCYREQTSKIG